MFLRRVLICSSVVMLMGCHRIFPYPSALSNDGSLEGSVTPHDIGIVIGDTLKLDQVSDQSSKTLLNCGEPQKIPNEGWHFQEPTISTDGKTIYANVKGKGFYQATRNEIDAPFGDWTLVLPAPAYFQDPDLFEFSGQTLSVSSKGDPDRFDPVTERYFRHLQICTGPFSLCEQISVFDMRSGSPTEITYDMDGPSMAYFGGLLWMVFNVQPDLSVGESTEIWMGKPRSPATDSDQLTWEAWPLENTYSFPYKEDDPTISRDGSIILFSWNRNDGQQSDLYVSYRAGSMYDFSNPQQLPEPLINTTLSESDVEIYTVDDQSIEIYFTRKEREERVEPVEPEEPVIATIFQARCSL